MTFVTLKTRWSYEVQSWSPPCPVPLNDLKWPSWPRKKVKVTRFKLGLCRALVFLFTNFGEDTSNISSDIERKPSFICCHLKWPLGPRYKVKVTQYKLCLCLAPALVLLCIKFGEDTSNISSDMEQKPSFIYCQLKWPVILKIRSRAPGLNLVFALPWCFSEPNLVRIHQIFL